MPVACYINVGDTFDTRMFSPLECTLEPYCYTTLLPFIDAAVEAPWSLLLGMPLSSLTGSFLAAFWLVINFAFDLPTAVISLSHIFISWVARRLKLQRVSFGNLSASRFHTVISAVSVHNMGRLQKFVYYIYKVHIRFFFLLLTPRDIVCRLWPRFPYQSCLGPF